MGRVPQDIHTRWIAFRTQMSDLNQLRIPRCVKLNNNAHQPIVEVHGFCDANARSEPTYLHQAQYQQLSVSLQVTVLKVSRRAAQDRLATAIRVIGRLTFGVLNQQD